METLLKNPKFWVAVVALLATIAAAANPAFAIDGEQAAAQVVVLVVYLYGVIRDPGGTAWIDMLRSRKFWTAVISEAALWLTAFQFNLPLGLTYDMIIEIVTAVASSLILAFAHTRTEPPPAQIERR